MAMPFKFIFWSLLLGGLCAAQSDLSTLCYNFTLAALNTTLPNANSTGAPLVLGEDGTILTVGINPSYSRMILTGATSGLTLHVTSVRSVESSFHLVADVRAKTYESYPYNDFPYLGLVNGTLRAYTASGWWATNATEVQSGGTLDWVTTTEYPTNAPQIYSSTPADQYYQLAADGFSNLWSLCPFPSTRQTNVVFNVSNTSSNYDAKECYSIQINIIPTD